ncbi:hypothetical protein GGR56DRAFT_683142 [Xylariaceae sp. FL0804]|nr:hypothetical protein GGR56DRAFT_683142 [Xylariaceae sp. FL0804]
MRCQFVSLLLASSALAASVPSSSSSSCANGPPLCCQHVQSSTSHEAEVLLMVMNEGLTGGTDVPVGMNCDNATVEAKAEPRCDSHTRSQLVCCEQNDQKGVVAVGCTPYKM